MKIIVLGITSFSIGGLFSPIDVEAQQSLVTETLDSDTYNLENSVSTLNLSEEEKERLIEEALNFFREATSKSVLRSHKDEMSTVIRTLSPEQVKEAARHTSLSGNLVGAIPKVGIPLAAIYHLRAHQLEKAAENGWGLKVTFTADKNNPTSSGMNFSWSYVK